MDAFAARGPEVLYLALLAVVVALGLALYGAVDTLTQAVTAARHLGAGGEFGVRLLAAGALLLLVWALRVAHDAATGPSAAGPPAAGPPAYAASPAAPP